MGPVLPKSARAAVMAINPKNSDVWPTWEVFRLTENMRAADDPEYGQFLERVGNGTLPTVEHEVGITRLRLQFSDIQPQKER